MLLWLLLAQGASVQPHCRHVPLILHYRHVPITRLAPLSALVPLLQYTREERARLKQFQSIDYLAPSSRVYRHWLAAQVGAGWSAGAVGLGAAYCSCLVADAASVVAATVARQAPPPSALPPATMNHPRSPLQRWGRCIAG